MVRPHGRTPIPGTKTVFPADTDAPGMKVLLGIGGTDDSFTALEQVVRRAAAAGDDLTVAVVENPQSEATPAEVEQRVRDIVADSPLSVADGDPESVGQDAVVVRRLAGDPGPQLVELADREEFDQLVLGGGERSPMGKIAVGEIAEYVLVNARVTVKLVR